MKNINVTFEDEEFNKLEQKKGDRSWHDFILLILTLKEAKKEVSK
jgi:predicted CopG family antitoxin